VRKNDLYRVTLTPTNNIKAFGKMSRSVNKAFYSMHARRSEKLTHCCHPQIVAYVAITRVSTDK